MTLPFSGLLVPTVRQLVSNIGLGAAYTATQSASNTSVILTIKSDGTWTVTFDPGDTTSGTPTSGTSLLTGGIAADHEVLFTVSNQVGSPVISNGAASYTALTSNRTVSVSKNGSAASADIRVDIRAIANPGTNVFATSNFSADGTP